MSLSNKKGIMISVDYSLWEKHKALGTNISKLCNQALYRALDGEKAIEEAQTALRDTEQETKAIEKQKQNEADLHSDLVKLRLAQRVFLANPSTHQHSNQHFSYQVDQLCEKHHLTRSEIMKLLDKVA